MQEQQTYGPENETDSRAFMTSHGLAALLALAGSRKLTVEELRRRMKLTTKGFENLLSWLQREYLVDLVSRLEGYRVTTSVVLTDKGERVLVGLLEKICELPETA